MITNSEQAVSYRAKARTLRSMAEDLPPSARVDLLRVAEEYDKMAARAEARPPDSPVGVRS